MAKCTYCESAPSAKLALVADSCGKAVTGHDLDGTEALFDEAMNRDRFPDGILGLFIDFYRVCVVARVGNVDGDTTQSTVVVGSARPDL